MRRCRLRRRLRQAQMTERVRLAELISPARRGTPSPTLPVYSVTKHRGFVPSLEYFNKQVFSKDLSNYKVVGPGMFAYATIHLDEGSIGIAPVDCLISPMYTAFEVDRSRVSTEYLIRLLKAPAYVAQYATLGRGTAERRRSISLDALGSLSIPLPPLPEQRRIASILDRVDFLRSQRRDALAGARALASSVFLDMFGSPFRNPMGLELQPIGNLGRVVTGNTPSRSNKSNYGGSLEWIKSDNIDPPKLHLTRAEETLADDVRTKARVVHRGAVLVTCIAGSRSSIGNAALADREVAFNQQINAFMPSRLSPRFALAQFREGKSLVQSASTDGMKGMVSKTRFEQIEFMVPSMEQQLEFERVVGHVDRACELHELHLAKLDELFASLQYRAFRGEL